MEKEVLLLLSFLELMYLYDSSVAINNFLQKYVSIFSILLSNT